MLGKQLPWKACDALHTTEATDSAGPESACASHFSQTFVHPFTYPISPRGQAWWAVLHQRCSSGIDALCRGQPGTGCEDAVCSLQAPVCRDLRARTYPTSRCAGAGLRVVGYARGTLFPSRANQAKSHFITMSSLWLCCNTNGRINWDSHPGFKYKHWKWHDNFVMLTPQLGIRRKETKILKLSSPRSRRSWSQI